MAENSLDSVHQQLAVAVAVALVAAGTDGDFHFLLQILVR